MSFNRGLVLEVMSGISAHIETVERLKPRNGTHAASRSGLSADGRKCIVRGEFAWFARFHPLTRGGDSLLALIWETRNDNLCARLTTHGVRPSMPTKVPSGCRAIGKVLSTTCGGMPPTM